MGILAVVFKSDKASSLVLLLNNKKACNYRLFY